MKITHTKITASDSAAKWWMAKYYPVDGGKKLVYFEGPSSITRAEKDFESWIPEPYKKAVFLGSLPVSSEEALRDEGFEKVNIYSSTAQEVGKKLPQTFSEWLEYAHDVSRNDLDPSKFDEYLHEYREFLKDKRRMRNTGVYSAEDSDLANSRKDRKRSPTNVRYKGYFIVLDRGGDGYSVYNDNHELEEEGIDSLKKAKEFVDNLQTKSPIHGAEETVDEGELEQLDQEFTSKETSINKAKLPAIYNLVNFPKGSLVIDYGGGKFDNGSEYLESLGSTGLVYDPYNRTSEHNRAVVRECRENGGADIGLCSNVLNVIKEPEVRKQVLTNMSKLVKNGGDIYITVYEGSGSGEGKQSQSDSYQLNRKTKDYLEEIQEVFPDATRKGKLIKATNTGAVTSNEAIMCNTDGLEEVKDMFEDGYQGSGWMEEEIKLDQGDGPRIKKYLEDLGYKVKKSLKDNIWILPDECFWSDTVFYPYRPDTKTNLITAARKLSNRTSPYQIREDMKELQDDLYNAASELLTSEEFGFPLNEIADYLVVEVTPIYEIPNDKKSKVYGYKAEVRAELTYSGMDELAQALNPVVEIRDSNAYFDHVTSGIIDAYMYFPTKYSPDDDIYSNRSITSAVSTSDVHSTMMRAVNITNREQLNDVLGDLLSIDKKLYLHFCDLDQSGEYSPAALGKMISNELYWKLDKGSYEDTDDVVSSTDRINLPGYAVQWVTGYAGNGVNRTDVKFFRTPEERDKYAQWLRDHDAYGVETYEKENFYHTLPEEVEASEVSDSSDDIYWEEKYYNSELEREEYVLHTPNGTGFVYGFDHDGRWGYHALTDPIKGRKYQKSFYLGDSLERAKKYCEEHLKVSTANVQGSDTIYARLVEPPQDVVDDLLKILSEFNFELDDRFEVNPGKTWMGNTHLQVINKSSQIDESEIRTHVPREMINKIHDLEKSSNCPITWNFGVDEDGHVTGGLDIDKQWIPDDVEPSQNIQSASYGGAYDIEDDQYFTKEELVEFGDSVAGQVCEETNHEYFLESIYLDGKVLDITITNKDVSVGGTVYIDMRRIRQPSDIYKYKDTLVGQLVEEIQTYYEDGDYSQDVQSSTVAGCNSNRVQLTENSEAVMSTQEYVEWDDPQDDVKTYEVEFDCQVVVEEDGSYYIPEDYTFKEIYDDDYKFSVVDDRDTIAEYLQDMLEYQIPEDPGTYRVSGVANMVFEINNIYVTSTAPESDSTVPGYYYNMDEADVKFDPRSSVIDNFQYEKV